MNKPRDTSRLALTHVGGLQRRDSLAKDENAGYISMDREDAAQNRERLLASPSPSGESDLTACEKVLGTCDCACHQGPLPRRMTWSRVNIVASVFWLLGVLLTLFALGEHRSTPANGTFGWCMLFRDAPYCFMSSLRALSLGNG